MPMSGEIATILPADRWEKIHRHWITQVNDPKGHLQVVPPRHGFEEVAKYTQLLTELMWPPREISNQGVDAEHFEHRIEADAQQVVYRTAVYFVVADKVVGELLEDATEDYRGEKLPFVCTLLNKAQEGQEVVHVFVYQNIITQCFPRGFQNRAFKEAGLATAIQGLQQWARGLSTEDVPIFVRVAARTAFELVTFTALFMVPHELKKNGLMPTFTNANERIAPDETNHAKAGLAMYRAFFSEALGTPGELREDANRVLEAIMRSCYEAALPLFEWVFEGGARVGSITKESALEYTRRTVNVMLEDSGAHLVFDESKKSANVTEWLSSIMMERMARTNFFEEDGLTYSKEYSETAFKISEDGGRAEVAQLEKAFDRLMTI